MHNNLSPMSRRTALQMLGGVTAAAMVPPSSLAQDRTIIKRAIPSSGEEIPMIGLGTSRTFDVGDDDEAISQLVDVLQVLFDNGGTVIDSSPMYRSAESVVGQLLKRTTIKETLFAATKVWTEGKEEGIAQMQESARRMEVAKIDLMQVHNLRDWQTQLGTLKDWKAQGKIRYIGITTSHGRGHEEFEAVIKAEPLDFVQFTYNIGNRVAEERLLPLAADRGMATMINRPFQRGTLFQKVADRPLPDWAQEFDCASWGQFFLKFVAGHPATTCIIPATAKLHHMEDNMAANFGRLPDQATRTRMIDLIESL